MKKFITILVAVLTFANQSASYAYQMVAEDVSGRWGIGVDVAVVYQADASDTEAEPYVGGSVMYGYNDKISLGLEAGRLEFNQKLGGQDFGDLEGYPLFAIMQYRYPYAYADSIQTALYGLIGVGAVFWTFKESQQLEQDQTSIEINDALALKIGGGIDIFLYDNIAANFEGSYVFSGRDITLETSSFSNTGTVDTDYWSLGGGFTYYL